VKRRWRLAARLCGAQLGFRFRRRDGGNPLSSRDLVAFVHRQRREPAGIFCRDIDLRRFDAAVRFHDSIGHVAAAQARDECLHLGSQLLGGAFLRPLRLRSCRFDPGGPAVVPENSIRAGFAR
jgi:hypothetical protein